MSFLLHKKYVIWFIGYIQADLEKMKKNRENSLKRPGISWTKKGGNPET
jgi:hypothetical protein